MTDPAYAIMDMLDVGMERRSPNPSTYAFLSKADNSAFSSTTKSMNMYGGGVGGGFGKSDGGCGESDVVGESGVLGGETGYRTGCDIGGVCVFETEGVCSLRSQCTNVMDEAATPPHANKTQRNKTIRLFLLDAERGQETSHMISLCKTDGFSIAPALSVMSTENTEFGFPSIRHALDIFGWVCCDHY
tara:strand:- start:1302 stop:1865 length:564 start_codon:yes stop_codon:yes gene_type:complete